MILRQSTRSKISSVHSRLLILCLLLSLGMHLSVVLLLPLLQQQDNLQPLQQHPTIVRLVDLPTTTKQKQREQPSEFEVDPLPVKLQPEVPVESFRKADRNQKMDQEQAPKGNDVRDQTTQTATPVLSPGQKQQQPEQKTVRPAVEKTEIKTVKTNSPETSVQPEQLPIPQPQLSPEQLRPTPSTLNLIANGSQSNHNRIKERENVKIGNEVWLNLQHNLLVSFFRRFHDQIELVWNYPTKAVKAGIEGTLELMIIVDQKGELLDVDLKQSSGSDLLDFEAIQAVYRAAPFGPLTKHYPHDELKIRAHFSYHLGGKFIYGR